MNNIVIENLFDQNRIYAFTKFIDKLKELNMNNMTGIEIGCYSGQSAEFFINSGLFNTFYCIDSWTNGWDKNDRTFKSAQAAEKVFDNRFKDNEKIIKIKNYSWNVANKFQDESIDFIYIDGNHTYEGFKKDLKLYYPKIKTGCIFSGHDYKSFWGVYKVLNEFLKTDFFKNKSSFTTFSDSSWMIIK